MEKYFNKIIYFLTISLLVFNYINKNIKAFDGVLQTKVQINYLLILVLLTLFLISYFICLFIIINLVIKIETSIYTLKQYEVNINFTMDIGLYLEIKSFTKTKKVYINNMVFRC